MPARMGEISRRPMTDAIARNDSIPRHRVLPFRELSQGTIRSSFTFAFIVTVALSRPGSHGPSASERSG